MIKNTLFFLITILSVLNAKINFSTNGDFSNFWQDNFLVGSLNKKTLYRIKFDNSYNKTIIFEEIFVGDRIRDIIYLENENVILLSLELSGSIGIIKNKI